MFKIGDKVIPIDKTIGKNKRWSGAYKQGYGYVKLIYGDGSGRNPDNCIIVADKMENSGDYYKPTDLIYFNRYKMEKGFNELFNL